MSRNARELYQELILEHGHRPRNTGALPSATHEATADNPLCGDRVTLRLELGDGIVRQARFEARGCLIATAAASLVCEALIGRRTVEARAIAAAVVALDGEGSTAELGPLASLAGARAFPARIACATLASKATLDALNESDASR